jgi:hypothetical protein
MWSLPDIQRLNSDARTSKRRLIGQPKRINCGGAKRGASTATASGSHGLKTQEQPFAAVRAELRVG